MIRRELGFFIFNGIVSVAITYAVYRGLVACGVGIRTGNGVGYVSGMMYGFFANRTMAFRDGSSVSSAKVIRYGLLHLSTLSLNVCINSAILDTLNGIRANVQIAFLAAITVSATLNFLGLKYWVFNRKPVALRGEPHEGGLAPSPIDASFNERRTTLDGSHPLS